MTDNPEAKNGANSSLPPKLDLRKRVGISEGDAEDKPVTPKLTSVSTPPGTIIPLKPRDPSPAAPPPGQAPRISPATPAPSAEGQTVHIQIPKPQTQTPSAMMPPKPTLSPTPTLSPKPASAPVAPSAAQPSAPLGMPAQDNKKETSKIPLASASAESPTVRSTPASGGPVKTIRIRPKSATTQTQKVAEPGVLAGATDLSSAEKKKTSRISLSAALSADQDSTDGASSGSRPKTIRLKRPSEAATVKVTPKSSMTGTATDRQLAPSSAKLSETARLDIPPAAQTQSSLTQRKTIRVKRPTQQSGVAQAPSRLTTAASGPAGRPTAGAPMAAAPVRADEPHVIFPIFAILTLLIVMVGLYLFSAQAFGPNSSFTQLSYAMEGPDLGWPGKLPPPRQ